MIGDYTVDYATSPYGQIETLVRQISRDCRCIKEVKTVLDPMSSCCRVRVTRIDTGIWEWNDEIVSC